MSKTKGKSKNPAYPDAHPTAPGGMSEKALIAELVEKHGFDEANAKALSWPQKIDVVAENRRLREQEAAQQIMADNEGRSLGEVEEALFDAGLDPDDFDPDDLMSELITARDEAADEPIIYGLLTKDPHTADYIFNEHAGAGPSASERWMHCTASLQASREFLETLTTNQQRDFAIANESARQGTTAHAAAEAEANMILGNLTQDEVDLTLLELSIEPENGAEAYDDEMAEYITEYTDLIRTYAQERGDDQVLIEARVEAAVPLAGDHDDETYVISGSADCIVLPTEADPTLVVADLKYGNGIFVEVDENPQVRIYGLAALGLLVNEDGELITDVETVTYHIVQPRLGGIKTWSEPVEDLLQWRDEVLSGALTAALYGPSAGAKFAPSEQACQFCPARGTCPALAEQRIEAASELFDTIVEAEFADGPGSFPETSAMSDEVLGKLLSQVSGLMDIHKDLKAEVERRLFRGGTVPGFGLVRYQPPRKWTEDAETKFAKIAKLWTKKLITPTAAEKLLGEEYDKVEPYVDKPDARPVIAREGDRRRKWEGRPPEAMFDIEEGS